MFNISLTSRNYLFLFLFYNIILETIKNCKRTKVTSSFRLGELKKVCYKSLRIDLM